MAAAPAHPALDGPSDCDVCVVGAGIAGCAAALHLSERGYRVIVLEAVRVGHGARVGELIRDDARDLDGSSSRIARSDLRRLWQLRIEAVATAMALMTEHHIACDFAGGQLLAALKPRHYRQLRAFKRELEEACGYPHLLFIEKDYLDEFVHTSRYTAGLYDARGGHVHPLKYALGLAAAAQNSGVRFFEASPVLHVDTNTSISVRTPRGTIHCRHVLLCGAENVGGFAHDPSPKSLPIGIGTTATEPLGEARARDILPTNAAVTDMSFMRDHFSLSADWRLLFGGSIGRLAPTPQQLAASLRRRMLRVFPQLQGVRQEHTWGGAVDLATNCAPRFGRLHPRVYFAHGCASQGAAMAVLGGQLLAGAVAGTAGRFDFLAKLPHRDLPGGKLLRGPLHALAVAYYRLRDWL